MNLIRRYLMVIFVGVSLLFGIQAPNFLDQYEKRIDAHLREVTRSLAYYEKIAAKHYDNNLYSLIAYHKGSDDQAFREEGAAIEDMYNRKRRFEMDKLAANNGFFVSALHIVTDGNKELLNETLSQYSYAVPLNQDAIASGVLFAVTAIFLVELLFTLFGAAARRHKLKRKTQINAAVAKANLKAQLSIVKKR